MPDNYRLDASVRPGARNVAVVVIATAVVILISAKSILGEMFDKTHNLGWDTPPNSYSLAAGKHVEEFFPNRMRGAVVMAVEALPTDHGTPSVLTDVVAEFSRNVSESVSKDSRVKPFAPFVVGYYLNGDVPAEFRKVLQAELVSPDRSITAMLIQPTKLGGDWEDASMFLKEFCSSPPPGYTLHITGMMAVVSGDGCYAGKYASVSTKDMSFEGLLRCELVTVPIALFITGKLIKYYMRLLLVPLFVLIVAYVVACAGSIPFMDKIDVANDTPIAMGSVATALALDYGLFFLTRFSEQHTDGWALQHNVDTVRHHTGRTVLVSGTLIAISQFGTMILPERNLKGTGLVMGIGTLACVVTAITLIPAVLLVFGKFLTGTVIRIPVDIDLQGFSTGREEMNEAIDPSRQPKGEKSHWLSMMRLIDRHPIGAITAVMVLMSPLLIAVPNLRISGDRFALFPMGMPALKALRVVQEHFPVGVLDPYTIVITAPEQVANASLSNEVEHGIAALGKHDLRAEGASAGLSPEESSALAKAVKDAQKGHVLDNAALTKSVDCKKLAAVAAGAASAVDKAHGLSEEHALKSALRAAKKSNCASADTEEAFGAAASVFYADGKRPTGNKTKEAVRSEAVKLGFSHAAAARIADTVTGAQQQAAHETRKTSLAAARAGAAAGLGELHGQASADTLKDSLNALKGLDISMGDASQIVSAVVAVVQKGKEHEGDASREVKAEAKKQGLNDHAAAVVAAFLMSASNMSAKDLPASVKNDPKIKPLVAGAPTVGVAKDAVATTGRGLDEDAQKKLNLIIDLVGAVTDLTGKKNGMLLMPSGFDAMLELNEMVRKVGSVASMLGPTVAFRKRIDWVDAVACHAKPSSRRLYRPLLQSHVNGNRALLEVHTTFPSIGPGGADWVLAVRDALTAWQSLHPGYKAELSGGASEMADMRSAVIGKMWTYLALTAFLILLIVCATFRSVMVPVRLVFALFFTLAATYGMAAIVYQTDLLHGLFPWLAPFHGVTFEVVPMVTGVCIALGLDYDIFLVSRIVEYRTQGFSDRASVFRGATKAGGVISGAGIIMCLALGGICFADKLIFQQFGFLLIASVLFDTYVVRTVLVPALMMIAEDWNWWPRKMPHVMYTALEGEVDSTELGYTQLLG